MTARNLSNDLGQMSPRHAAMSSEEFGRRMHELASRAPTSAYFERCRRGEEGEEAQRLVLRYLGDEEAAEGDSLTIVLKRTP